MRLKVYTTAALMHVGVAWYLLVMIVARGLWQFSPRLAARWCLVTRLYEACRQLVLREQLERSLDTGR